MVASWSDALGGLGGLRRPGSAARASARFAAVIGPPEAIDNCAWVGIENEYRVWSPSQGQLDFREMVGGLGLGRDHLDPRDRYAYRLGSGATLTADEREAEIALAPWPVLPGFVDDLDAAAAADESELGARLPGCSLRGHSTHISVSVAGPEARVALVARTYAQAVAPAAMLMLAQAGSTGVIIRPRPRRVELVTEYLDSPRRRAAVGFAVASIKAVEAVLATGSSLAALEADFHIAISRQRPGWFVSRHICGGDLCSAGRNALLSLRGGATLSAQEHLERVWALAALASPGGSAEDFEAAEAAVRRRAPLPSEVTANAAIKPARLVPTADARRELSRPGIGIAPVMMSWHVQVYVAVDLVTERRAFICVPQAWTSRFQARLDEGDLDPLLSEYLAGPRSGRRLARLGQTVRPGIFDQLGPRRELLLREPAARLVAA